MHGVYAVIFTVQALLLAVKASDLIPHGTNACFTAAADCTYTFNSRLARAHD